MVFYVAERMGFEPMVPLPVHVLSKHAESATLAPLRTIFLVAFLPVRANFQTAQAGLSLIFSKVQYFITGPSGPQG